MKIYERVRDGKFIGNIIIIICIVVLIYLCVSIHFTNHFNLGTTINGVKVSGLTVDGANKKIAAEFDIYKLELQGRDGVEEVILGSEIELQYNPQDKLQKLKNEQNPLGWIFGIIKNKDYKVSEICLYNEALLKERFQNLLFFKEENIIFPKDVTFEFKDNKYEMIEEVYGNKIKEDLLYQHLLRAIISGEKRLNLEEINCYENPKYISYSKEASDAENMLNKYILANITYDFGEKKEVIDKFVIKDCISISENLEVTIDEKKVKSYLVNIAKKYNTIGKTRSFRTSLGGDVIVKGGYYGWRINVSAEVEAVIKEIQEGKNIIREPVYFQRAASHKDNDIGDTYVEISIDNQELWFYKKGKIIANGAIVTGNVSRDTATPLGTYMLTYKERNSVLKGDDYATEVKYWMPFNGNIGIHDASWRYDFGGQIYRTNGSHGCVNISEDLAKILFENIEANTPVICY